MMKEESEDEDSDSEDETSLEEEEDEEGDLSLEDVTIAATKNLANLQNCKRHSTIFMVRPLLEKYFTTACTTFSYQLVVPRSSILT